MPEQPTKTATAAPGEWLQRPYDRVATFDTPVAVKDRAAGTEDDRRLTLSFSSEYPVQREMGLEILDHQNPASANLSRLNDGAAVRDGHWGNQVGVVEKADIRDGKGRATIRLGKSQRATELLQDVRDGIVRNVSFRYIPHESVREKHDDTGDTYRVVNWEAVHIAFEPDPADPTVGVGRAAAEPDYSNAPPVRILYPMTEKDSNRKDEPTMETKNDQKTEAAPVTAATAETVNVSAGTPATDTSARDIALLGQRFNRAEMAGAAIAAGKPLDVFRDELMESLGARKADATTTVGMSPKEVRRYSFVRAIGVLASGKPLDGLEGEADQAARKLYHKEPAGRGFMVPDDVLTEKRDLTVGVGTAGGFTVATDLLTGSFIDLLRNKMLVKAAGATQLGGLVGNVAIPGQTSGATAFWVAENVAVTESQQVFRQVALTPKTQGAYTDLSRKLLLQSSMDIEGFVRNDLATTLALELDRVAINGNGVGAQPTGILNTAGLPITAMGVNGALPTWASIVALETAVANANSDTGSLGYMTNPRVRGRMKVTVKVAGTSADMLWEKNPDPLNGYPAYVTNQVPNTLTKGASVGICSAMLFGNWSSLVQAYWAGVSVLVDPYTGGAAGTVRVIMHQDVDIAVRRATDFAAIVDYLT